MDKLQLERDRLDRLDDQIIALFSQRFGICRDIAIYKSETSIPMMQESRVAQVKKRVAEKAKSQGLSEEFVASLYDLVIKEACRLEDDIINNAHTTG